MRRYLEGTAVIVGAPFLITPSAQRAAVTTAHDNANALNSDIQRAQRAGRIDAGFVLAWSRFYGEETEFYWQNYDVTVFSSKGVYDKAEEYRIRVDDWRTEFNKKAVGVQASGPRDTEVDKIKQEREAPLIPWWVWLLGGVAAVGGVAALAGPAIFAAVSAATTARAARQLSR